MIIFWDYLVSEDRKHIYCSLCSGSVIKEESSLMMSSILLSWMWQIRVLEAGLSLFNTLDLYFASYALASFQYPLLLGVWFFQYTYIHCC
jgi:hypothetical protein